MSSITKRAGHAIYMQMDSWHVDIRAINGMLWCWAAINGIANCGRHFKSISTLLIHGNHISVYNIFFFSFYLLRGEGGYRKEWRDSMSLDWTDNRCLFVQFRIAFCHFCVHKHLWSITMIWFKTRKEYIPYISCIVREIYQFEKFIYCLLVWFWTYWSSFVRLAEILCIPIRYYMAYGFDKSTKRIA